MTNEELLNAIRAGNQDNNSLLMELWNQNAGMIGKACGKFAERLEPEDAKQECYFALVDAVENYDPEAGATFAGYLYRRCIWHLSRYHENTGGTIRIPKGRRQAIKQYIQFVRLWYQSKGQPPDSRTLYFALGLDRDHVKQLRADMQALNIYSLDAPLTEDPEGDTTADTVQDKTVDVESAITDKVFDQERKRAVWGAVDGLKPAESEAIRMKYQNGMTYKQAAAVSGVSPQRIQARLSSGLRRLRTEKQFKELRDFVDMSPVYGKGIQGTGTGYFNRTGTSATEKTALWMLEAEERWRKERDKLDKILERNRRDREDYKRRKAGG